MSNFLLITETNLDSSHAWYPWLEKEISKREHKLYIVESNGDLDESVSKTSEFLKYLDSDSMIIGHGFGVKVALKLLEKKSRVISATMLVAGKLDDEQYDFENIKNKSREFFVYGSDEDAIATIDDVEHLANMLDETILLIPEANHFDKITDFEDILVDIISVLVSQKAI